MSAESSGVFTLKEINRIKIIQDVIERRITTRRAAEHLGISDRQCRRLLARYREGGPLGMASRRCGMRGNRQLPPGLADQALELIKTRYADFGPTLARESSKNSTDCFLAKKLSGASWCGLAYGFPVNNVPQGSLNHGTGVRVLVS
ncbi:transposase [Klebsiella pneumoniae]|nr:transposase [Klebsiella pneumoniae]